MCQQADTDSMAHLDQTLHEVLLGDVVLALHYLVHDARQHGLLVQPGQ